MTSSTVTSSQPPRPQRPNIVFRRLRGQRSPGEFAAAVRRAARDIGERVSCDARYIGRVEAGEIRCPNYAYERVFLHMFPGRTLTDLGFAPRSAVRGRGSRPADEPPPEHAESRPDGPYAPTDEQDEPYESYGQYESREPYGPQAPQDTCETREARAAHECHERNHEESDVRRRAFMTGSTATVAAASLGAFGMASVSPATAAGRPVHRAGTSDAGALQEAVRRIRVLDDRHGADGLYRRAAAPLRTAYALL
ncbi:hypothetical protein ACFV8W_38940, partial [Streptomyces sp. NPDC059786]